ncbi:guanylate kinase [Mangrovivirga cuniculi]|uniref:Guanylate kinase n=1 Tax=Mangrovivirga cuniculi TaxID=2715131 RepID=A0A4D7JCB9_9BACT|nr:guanylate kinase [Mangrovivirga cuniculi]QCK14009.1 guanylate kinase [Mangrovivirga cuniculi]
MKEGKAIIFAAPSGSGKTTIVKHLLKNNDFLGFSISACTRDKRGRNEENGKDYYFLTPHEFKENIDADEFIEWEEVYPGNFYGTLKSEIQRLWDEGKTVIFDVDVKGALNLKEYFQDKALAVYVKVPSIDELAKRLRDRGTESEDSVSRRLFKAKFEMEFMDKFDVVLVNDDLAKAQEKSQQLLDEFMEK